MRVRPLYEGKASVALCMHAAVHIHKQNCHLSCMYSSQLRKQKEANTYMNYQICWHHACGICRSGATDLGVYIGHNSFKVAAKFTA